MESVDVVVYNSSPYKLPEYAKSGDSGMDVRANIKEAIILKPGATVIVPVGLFVELRKGYEIQVRPRSGLAAKYSVTVLNTPGTIDEGYRNEIGVILINHHQTNDFIIEPGDRIAQIVLQQVPKINWIPKETMVDTNTERGLGRYGHTGRS